MLAVMIPQESQTWFFKVTGPEPAIESIEPAFREFLESVAFKNGEPDLSELPDGWKHAGKKAFRFASVNIETPNKQLDLSISSLSKQADWDQEVAMNVNRWRGQLGLEKSGKKWAGAEPVLLAATKEKCVWVDLLGEASSGPPAMTPPMLGQRMPRPAAPGPSDSSSEESSRFDYDLPEGWIKEKAAGMRLLAFSMGPKDAAAELTVISAGGDTRGNVKRWIGQIREDISDEIVDQAMDDVKKIKVGGRDAQRFVLNGDEAKSEAGDDGQSIDATIVPLEGNFSLFIKMTGPTKTVTKQYDAVASFLESLEF